MVSVFNSGNKVGYKVCHVEKEGLSYSGLLTPQSAKVAKKHAGKGAFLDVVGFQKLHSGEYVFSLESNYIVSTKYSSYPASGPVIFVGLDQKWNRLWENTLYKTQLTAVELANSHRSVTTKSGLLVIYNESNENLALEPGVAKFKKLKRSPQSLPMAVEINAKGEMKRYPLYKEVDLMGFALDMNHFLVIEKGKYLFKIAKDPSFGKYETAYGKLELN